MRTLKPRESACHSADTNGLRIDVRPSDAKGVNLFFFWRRVLAVAAWWTERQKEGLKLSRVALAKKLYEQNFDQVESDYLVRLISRVQLSKDEKVSFDDWGSEKDRKDVFGGA